MTNKVNGVLMKTTKTNKLSPDLLGTIEFSRELLVALLKATNGSKIIEVQVACWLDVSKAGNKYYRVEATPMYQAPQDATEVPARSEGLFGLD